LLLQVFNLSLWNMVTGAIQLTHIPTSTQQDPLQQYCIDIVMCLILVAHSTRLELQLCVEDLSQLDDHVNSDM